MTTYTGRLTESIARLEEALRSDTKTMKYGGVTYNVADRQERMRLVELIADKYIVEHAEFNQPALDAWIERGYKGQKPSPVSVNTTLLDRLADAIFNEELTDKHKNKISATEYPFMSTWQLDVRRDREYSIDLAENHGVDGVNHNVPARRHRTAKETRFVDKLALMKNRNRKAQYKRDTSPGELVTYNLHDTGGEFAPEFTDRVGIGERWMNELSPVYQTISV